MDQITSISSVPNVQINILCKLVDHGLHDAEKENPYSEKFKVKVKAKEGFTLVFKIYRENCKHTDFVKLSNTGWQGGNADQVNNR